MKICNINFTQLPYLNKNKFKQSSKRVIIVSNDSETSDGILESNGDYLLDTLNNKLIAKE